MHKCIFALMMGVVALLFMDVAVSAAEWGSLKGRFVVDGTPATLPPLVVNKDEQYCGPKMPQNEAIVIGKGDTLVNAVVFLRAPLGQKVAIHPDYEAKLKQPAVLDNNGCAFHPHILLTRVGQDVLVTNSDPVGHNTNLSLFGQNPIVPANGKTTVKNNQDAGVPQPIACNIHGWMKAHLVSLNHPYMAASGQDGTFEIKDIPAGTHEFQFWQEAAGYLKNLKFKGGTTDGRGRAKLKIEAGQTLDLGDLKVPARVLVPK